MMSKILNPFFVLCALIIYHMSAAAGTIAPSASASRNAFATDLFGIVSNSETHKNLIYSPASIQSALTLAFMGAGGQTEEQLRHSLKLGVSSKEDIARNYGDFLKSVFRSTNNGPVLKMANRIYVNDGLKLAPSFNEIARQHFNSEAEPLRFADSTAAVQKINQWVAAQTDNKIQNLLQPGAVNGQTSSVLVNAIYFKGLWAKPFSKDATHRADFSVSANQKIPVDMMYQDDKFQYADLPELDATALEMPYNNSDLKMLIILPKKVDGLKQLEQKLSTVDLNAISSRLKKEDVNLFLPKFKVESDIDLKSSLQKLGMSEMFSDNANFVDLLISTTPQKVADVKHKAFLDVNEAGSEAAAATYMKIVLMSLNVNQKDFKADHPFVFAIRNDKAVYFAGHVAKF